jgi:hypothetical protein
MLPADAQLLGLYSMWRREQCGAAREGVKRITSVGNLGVKMTPVAPTTMNVFTLREANHPAGAGDGISGD